MHLLRKLGTSGQLELAHMLLLPAGVIAEQLFEGEAARWLLLGNAMHADVPIDAPGSGVMGYLLIMMAQDGGWPVPVGGAVQLAAALVNRARSAGAQIECGREVVGIEVRGRRAVAVHNADGATVRTRRAVIADTSAPRLYVDLLPLIRRAGRGPFTADSQTGWSLGQSLREHPRTAMVGRSRKVRIPAAPPHRWVRSRAPHAWRCLGSPGRCRPHRGWRSASHVQPRPRDCRRFRWPAA